MIEETFAFHNYYVQEETQSKIDSRAKINDVIGFHCPHCRYLIKPALKHGESINCDKCNMKMTLYGNGLHCYLNENS